MKKYASPPSNTRATRPHATPMPAFAPVDKPELDFEVDEVSDPAVLFGELEDVFEGSDEVELGDEDEVEDEVDEDEIEALEDVVAEERADVLVGAEVETVAPDEPNVTASVLNWTWNRPIPESQHPFV